MSKRSDFAKNNKKKMELIILAIVVIAASVFFFTVIKDKRMIEQADSLVAIEQYDNGIEMYDNILTKKYSDDVMEKREHAIELREENESYQLGMDALDDEDSFKAIKYFSKVPASNKKLYQKATDNILDIEETTSLEVEELIERKDFNEAYKVVNNYLKAAPDSEEMSEMKKTLITSEKKFKNKNSVAKVEEEKKVAQAKSEEEKKVAEAKIEEEKQAKVIEDEKRKQEAKAIASAEKKETEQEELKKRHVIANNILNTYQTVVTEPGNLRAAPTLEGAMVAALPKGTELYIMDTHVENLKRTWCEVEVEVDGMYYTGWISYNTMNYSIR